MTELVRDTLHLVNLRYERLEKTMAPTKARNVALETDNSAMTETLKKRGIKFYTRYLPAPVTDFTEGEAAKQRRIEELTAANNDLWGTISDMRDYNDKDKIVPSRPAAAVAAVRREVEEKAKVANKTAPKVSMTPEPVKTIKVNARMQEQLDRVAVEGLRGKNFRVNILREEGPEANSDKRRLVVDFDLNRIPAKFQGDRRLYLVITDRRGETITSGAPVRAAVPFGGVTIDLTAMAEQQTSFGSTQHVSMIKEMNGTLSKGQYRAQVYSDVALLGMTDFLVE